MKTLIGLLQGAALQQRSMTAGGASGNAKCDIELTARPDCMFGFADMDNAPGTIGLNKWELLRGGADGERTVVLKFPHCRARIPPPSTK